MKVTEQRSHEDYFLEQGFLLALGFREGWFCSRVVQKTWSNLQPWSLGAVVAGGSLAAYNEIQDANANHYLEPFKEEIIYHSFWGVTPAPARIKLQYPTRVDLGSMLESPRSLIDNVGFIDGYKSPFWGPYSPATEIFTISERYPGVQVNNPVADPMPNVMLNVDQRQYSYEVITDKALITDMLIGNRRVKKYTMGVADPLPMTAPKWLTDRIGADLLAYSLKVMAGGKV